MQTYIYTRIIRLNSDDNATLKRWVIFGGGAHVAIVGKLGIAT